MDNITIILISAILFLTVVIVFNRITFVRRITRLMSNEVKFELEPLPKPTKLRHDVTVNISIIDDFEKRMDMEKIYEAVEHMRKELMVAYGMTDVEITGRSTRPWFL